MILHKGKWLTNAGKNEREAYVNAGFIVWNPQPTETYNEQELIKMGLVGVYANPMKPDAVLPPMENLRWTR